MSASRRNAINKLGQHYVVQMKNEIEERLNDCEELLEIHNGVFNKITDGLQRIVEKSSFGYVTDRVIFLDIKFEKSNLKNIVLYDPLEYTVKIPGAVQLVALVGPGVIIHKNKIEQTQVPFSIQYNDKLEFTLVKPLDSFQDSILSFIIKYKNE